MQLKINLYSSFLCISLSALLFFSCNQASTSDTSSAVAGTTTPVEEKVDNRPIDKNYEIGVRLNNYKQPKIYLGHYYGNSNRLRDSAELVNGSYLFKGEVTLEPGMYLVILPPTNRFFEVVVDKDQHFTIETDTTDLIGNLKIEGSIDNQIFYDDINFLSEQREKITPLQQRFQQAQEGSSEYEELKTQMAEIDSTVMRHRRKLNAEHGEKFYPKFLKAMARVQVPEAPEGADESWQFYYYRGHFWDDIDFSDGRMLRSVVLGNKVKEYMDNLTPKHPDSVNKSIDLILGMAKENDDAFQYFVAHLLNTYGIENKQMGMDAVFVHVVERYYLSGAAWWADSAQLANMEERALALSPNLIGRKAPDFTASDENNQARSLYSVNSPYTILYFWDYDCGHCKTVTPKLAEIWPKYKDKGVALYALSINGDIGIWKEKIEEYNLTGAINVQDHRRQSGFDGMYDIRSTPRIFLLDQDKKILYKQFAVEDLEGILEHEFEKEEEETD
ncbi:MAG: DUF5106 domain-containing protein [Bacteroidota bacterium]